MARYREITLVEKSASLFKDHQRHHAKNQITHGRVSRQDAYDALGARLEQLVLGLLRASSEASPLRLWDERVLSYVDLKRGRRHQRFRELDGVIGDREEPVYLLELKASTSDSVRRAARQANRAREILAHRFAEVAIAAVWIDTSCLRSARENIEREDSEDIIELPEPLPARALIARLLGERGEGDVTRDDISARIMLEELLACCEEDGLIEDRDTLMDGAREALLTRSQPQRDASGDHAHAYAEEGFVGESPFTVLSRGEQ